MPRDWPSESKKSFCAWTSQWCLLPISQCGHVMIVSADTLVDANEYIGFSYKKRLIKTQSSHQNHSHNLQSVQHIHYSSNSHGPWVVIVMWWCCCLTMTMLCLARSSWCTAMLMTIQCQIPSPATLKLFSSLISSWRWYSLLRSKWGNVGGIGVTNPSKNSSLTS